jgi:hypothetical protein
MQNAYLWRLVLGGTAAALLATTPCVMPAAATAESNVTPSPPAPTIPAAGPSRVSSLAAPIIVPTAPAAEPATEPAVPLADVAGPVLPATAAGDTLWHRVQPGDTLHKLAIRYRGEAGWFSQADCLAAIRAANDMLQGHLLRPGRQLAIPVHRAPAPPRAARPTRDGADLRGLYLPAAVYGDQTLFARIDSFVTAGGNGVVIDAKDIDGGVSFRSAHPLARWGAGRVAPVISDLADLVARLHARELWVVVRLAVFLDGELGAQRPDLALRGPDGTPWAERDCVWLDPAQPAVQDYNRQLALELVRAGVDEVQLDYVRYPTNGWRGDCTGDLATTAAARRRTITGFVASLHDTLRALGCVLSADLYGIMAWDRTEDLALTGQHVPSLAPHLDVICPMIYPSHFAPGFEGLARPGDHPELMITAGVERFAAQAGPGTLIRPWLQAFPWRVSNYDAGYVTAQIRAAEAAGAAGWCLWNPAGRYDVARAAMRQGPPQLAAAVTPEP